MQSEYPTMSGFCCLTLYLFIRFLDDKKMIVICISASIVQLLPILYENIQVNTRLMVWYCFLIYMLFGSVPLLTRGPLAVFLGGEKMLNILADAPPGKALLHLSVFTFVFQVCISTYKKYLKHIQRKPVSN